MQRNAMNNLIAWKNSAMRKPLVINGARQVGKTWLVTEFGRAHFKELAYVMFLDNEDMQNAFSGSLDPQRLLTLIGAATGTNPRSGETLVFFDEIQECPRAITSLKFFCEQCPEVPVVAAGSLLGLALSRSSAGSSGSSSDSRPGGRASASWPVGKVNYLDMHPMSFDEYVAAAGNEQLAELLRSGDVETMDALSERFVDLLKTYLFVGGMPEAVSTYVATGDFAQTRRVHTELLNGYERDFAKHPETPLETERIRQTWKSVPTQLAREGSTRRFVYASIREHARGRDYRNAISWLLDAGLVTKVPRVSKPGLPLMGYADDTYFKLYLLDVGLLGAMTNLDAHAIVEGTRLFAEYRGAYAEQFVCQQLVAGNRLVPYYWSADGKNVKGEVDFVVESEGAVLPIEVKADKNVSGKSIAAFAKRYGIERSLRFSLLGKRDQGWLVNLPLYAANAFARGAIRLAGARQV